jgi:hypothetical protein
LSSPSERGCWREQQSKELSLPGLFSYFLYQYFDRYFLVFVLYTGTGTADLRKAASLLSVPQFSARPENIIFKIFDISITLHLHLLQFLVGSVVDIKLSQWIKRKKEHKKSCFG